jgi:hypothetical protein
MIKALTVCVDELDVKANTCETRLEDEIFQRLNESLVNEDYMHPMGELVIHFENGAYCS